MFSKTSLLILLSITTIITLHYSFFYIRSRFAIAHTIYLEHVPSSENINTLFGPYGNLIAFLKSHEDKTVYFLFSKTAGNVDYNTTFYKSLTSTVTPPQEYYLSELDLHLQYALYPKLLQKIYIPTLPQTTFHSGDIIVSDVDVQKLPQTATPPAGFIPTLLEQSEYNALEQIKKNSYFVYTYAN